MIYFICVDLQGCFGEITAVISPAYHREEITMGKEHITGVLHVGISVYRMDESVEWYR